jgi:hypothetical protein
MGGKVFKVEIEEIKKVGTEHIVYNASSEGFTELAAGVYAKVENGKVVIFADARKLNGYI